jgi:alanine racemase
MSSPARLRLTIYLDALAANWQRLAGTAPAATCAAAVKANAYGLGLAQVARRLAKSGCDTFFVATLAEGVQLRAILPNALVYVLDGVTCADDVKPLKLNGLIPVLNSSAQIALWQPWNGPCAVMVDTGMNRLGIAPDPTQLNELVNLNCVLLMSHLASADEPASLLNEIQRARFRDISIGGYETPKSLANSAGVQLGSAYHFDVVRPGIALYATNKVVTAEARVLQVRDIAAGESAGYNATWTAPAPTRLATIGVGYADGYMRGFSNTGHVWLGDRRCPVRGRVSMDLTIVEIGDAAVQPGDYAELFGGNISIDEASAASGMSQYELLTSLGPRYERLYLGA